MHDCRQTTREIRHRTTKGLTRRRSRTKGRDVSSRDPIHSREPTSRDLTTGLPNRWTLQKELGERAWRAHRNGDLLLLVVIRVDRDDDASEREAPDRRNRRLRELGRRLAVLTGPRDLLGRWETDRLLLISRPGMHRRGREIVEKIREIARDLDLPVSLGITFNEEVHDPPGLVRRAERGLDPPTRPRSLLREESGRAQTDPTHRTLPPRARTLAAWAP